VLIPIRVRRWSWDLRFGKLEIYAGFQKTYGLIGGLSTVFAKNGLRHRRRNRGSGWREPDPPCLSGEHHRQHDPVLPSTVSAVRDHHRIRLPRAGALPDSGPIRIGSFYAIICKLWGGIRSSTSYEWKRRKARVVQIT